MAYTHSALWPYLYGKRVTWELVERTLVAQAVKGDHHVYKNKQVETGFFDLPGAENISAVVFSSAGTIAKFDRMGLAAGFIPDRSKYRYYRVGTRFDPDPNAVHPLPFHEQVGGDKYVEFWSDELQIFHNPNAKRPLAVDAFGGVTQYFFKEGEQYSITPEGTVVGSRTMIMHMIADNEEQAAL